MDDMAKRNVIVNVTHSNKSIRCQEVKLDLHVREEGS
jgi:hypothetical protein